MTLTAARAELVTKITGTGLRVVTDPRDANPPCVIVGLPAGLTRRNACTIAGTVAVTAVAPPPGNDDAAGWLLDVVDQLAVLVGWTGADPSTWTPTGAGSELPAYTMTVPVHT